MCEKKLVQNHYISTCIQILITLLTPKMLHFYLFQLTPFVCIFFKIFRSKKWLAFGRTSPKWLLVNCPEFWKPRLFLKSGLSPVENAISHSYFSIGFSGFPEAYSMFVVAHVLLSSLPCTSASLAQTTKEPLLLTLVECRGYSGTALGDYIPVWTCKGWGFSARFFGDVGWRDGVFCPKLCTAVLWPALCAMQSKSWLNAPSLFSP